MMKIIVTGAYGQLGNEIRVCAEKFPDWKFWFTDVDSLDITKEADVIRFFKEVRPDFIVNCAAYTAVDKAETDEETARLVNAVAPGILAKVSAKYHAKLIQVSTDYVFNGEKITPYEETDEVGPTGVYGITKLEGEKLCFEGNKNSLVLRTSWLYSSFGNNFVKTMLRLGKEHDVLKVVFDQVGTPTYAADLAETILRIIEKEEKKLLFIPGIYHYSNEGVTSWFDFAKAIFKISKIDCQVKPVLSSEFPTSTRRPHYSVLNKSKIKDNFAVQIPYWMDSLDVCIKKLQNIN